MSLALALFFEDAIAHDFYEKDSTRRTACRYYETLERDHARHGEAALLGGAGRADGLAGTEGYWMGLMTLPPGVAFQLVLLGGNPPTIPAPANGEAGRSRYVGGFPPKSTST